jgi:predicted nucleic acid-binding protein
MSKKRGVKTGNPDGGRTGDTTGDGDGAGAAAGEAAAEPADPFGNGAGDGAVRPFAWDGPALRHAIAVGRVHDLLDLADHSGECDGRHVTSAAVVRQLALLDLAVPGRLEVVNVDDPSEVEALARWLDRTSSGPAGRVQATVCAWAEVHGAAAVLDDRGTRRVAPRGGLTAFGTLRVVARAVASGQVSGDAASGLVDRLIAAGARYPHGPGGFLPWARDAGHLD